MLARAYRLFNIVSLDIVIGAIVCALFFAKIYDVALVPYALVALGLSVWIIYTADHLMDARLLKWTAATERHRFHQRHFRKILIAMIFAAMVDATALYFVRSAVFKVGLILSVFVILYLLAHRYLKFLKEFAGAILYTLGILIPSVSIAQADWSLSHLILLFQFFLTAFINLLLFSWFDRKSDFKDKQVSFVLFFGERTTMLFLGMLFIVQILLAMLQVVALNHSNASYIILAMNGVLFVIMISSGYFSKDDRYRLFGDIIFLFPLIYLAG